LIACINISEAVSDISAGEEGKIKTFLFFERYSSPMLCPPSQADFPSTTTILR